MGLEKLHCDENRRQESFALHVLLVWYDFLCLGIGWYFITLRCVSIVFVRIDCAMTIPKLIFTTIGKCVRPLKFIPSCKLVELPSLFVVQNCCKNISPMYFSLEKRSLNGAKQFKFNYEFWILRNSGFGRRRSSSNKKQLIAVADTNMISFTKKQHFDCVFKSNSCSQSKRSLGR